MKPRVWICELQREWITWEWLCKAHILARRVQRDERGHLVWASVQQLTNESGRAIATDGNCSDCNRARQAAPGYVTPTVEAVQLAPDARIGGWRAA